MNRRAGILQEEGKVKTDIVKFEIICLYSRENNTSVLEKSVLILGRTQFRETCFDTKSPCSCPNQIGSLCNLTFKNKLNKTTLSYITNIYNKEEIVSFGVC